MRDEREGEHGGQQHMMDALEWLRTQLDGDENDLLWVILAIRLRIVHQVRRDDYGDRALHHLHRADRLAHYHLGVV